MSEKISIIGLGWFGSKLAQVLGPHYQVMGTTRSPEKAQAFQAQGIQAEILLPPSTPEPHQLNADVVILNIPPTAGQLEWFKSWKWNQKSHVIFISSTSVYGNLNGVLDETTLPAPVTEKANELLREENWFRTFPQCTIIRFGGLIGPDRHPGKILSGKTNLADGNHPVNLIHLDDAITFTRLVMEKHFTSEVFNLVHPDHPTRAQFYQDYCKKHELPLPGFVNSDTPGKIISHKKVSGLYSFCRNSVT